MKQLVHDSHNGNKHESDFVIFAEQLSSPYNVGSLFRLADALGVKSIYLGGETPLPPNRKISKTSRSTEQRVHFKAVSNREELIKSLKAAGFRLVALELCDQGIALEDFQMADNRPICLILGDERRGVSQESLDAADAVIHIPMVGVNSSMNVIQACAIATFTLLKQYR